MGKLNIQHSAILGRAKYMSNIYIYIYTKCKSCNCSQCRDKWCLCIYIYIYACGTYMYRQNVSYCRLKGCVDLDAVKKPQETP